MINRTALITALVNDYDMLCQESPDDDDITPDAYRAQLSTMTDAALVAECCVSFDDDYTINDYIAQHS